MKKNDFLLILLVLLLGCCSGGNGAAPDNVESKVADSSRVEQATDENLTADSLVVRETIEDSLKIGQRGKFKICLHKISNIVEGSARAEGKFFERIGRDWQIKQEFLAEMDEITMLDPQFSDFNNDGLNDLTFGSFEAFRGTNDNRYLFIFEKKEGKLLQIRGAENTPNLQFNPILNCLDSWFVWGMGSTTSFFKIEKDSLREFAQVSLFGNERVVTLFDKRGKERVLSREKTEKIDTWVRYSNFRPLVATDSLEM